MNFTTRMMFWLIINYISWTNVYEMDDEEWLNKPYKKHKTVVALICEVIMVVIMIKETWF